MRIALALDRVSLQTLIQIQIAKFLWRILRDRNFAVVEDDPFVIFTDVTNVMTDLRGSAHV